MGIGCPKHCWKLACVVCGGRKKENLTRELHIPSFSNVQFSGHYGKCRGKCEIYGLATSPVLWTPQGLKKTCSCVAISLEWAVSFPNCVGGDEVGGGDSNFKKENARTGISKFDGPGSAKIVFY